MSWDVLRSRYVDRCRFFDDVSGEYRDADLWAESKGDRDLFLLKRCGCGGWEETVRSTC